MFLRKMSELNFKKLQVVSDFSPAGSQPNAIKELVEGLNDGLLHQTLLGVTGSGKTYTMAKVIEETQRPAIVMAHNKTLAAQLYRGTIPKNGAHGMKLSAEDEKQLRNVDVKGNTTSVTFNTGLQVNLSPKIKEASGFASDADRKRAARMIVDQSMREGNKRKVFIHSYDLQGGPFQFKQRGDRRFAMELYKEAKRQGAKVSVRNMSALDTIRARMQLREEKKNGAGSEHGFRCLVMMGPATGCFA